MPTQLETAARDLNFLPKPDLCARLDAVLRTTYTEEAIRDTRPAAIAALLNKAAQQELTARGRTAQMLRHLGGTAWHRVAMEGDTMHVANVANAAAKSGDAALCARMLRTLF